MVKRYSDNGLLIFTNALVEYVLIVATYFMCGLIRLQVPLSIGRKFYVKTIRKFTPFILVVALLMILIFLIMGDYNTLHFKNKKWIVREVFAVSFAAGVAGASVLFFIDGSQFSRILLILIVLFWTVILSVKRMLFEAIALKMFSDKVETLKILVIGNGRNARKYYSGVSKDQSTRYSFVGYLAASESAHIPNYLGGYDRLYDVISELRPDKVVIAEDTTDRKFLSETLSVCGVFGIQTSIVPVFADYITEGQRVHLEMGTHSIDVNGFDTSNILGVNVSVTDMDKTIADITDNLDKWRGKYICVSNVHTTVMAHDDPGYLKVQNEAVMALPDGGPLSSYSRAEGKKEAARVTGPDLMREVLTRSGEYGWRHFFYGSTDKTLNMLREKIEKDYPGATIAGMFSPPFRDISPEEDAEYVQMINETKPDYIWVGLGAPKQEIWMAAHKDRVNGLMIGVGAAFDYESGNLKRAPKWMQKCNLEWLYRFMQEPRRLFKRYFVTNIKFLWLTRR